MFINTKILIVEDAPATRDHLYTLFTNPPPSIKRLYKINGLNVEKVGNAKDALSCLEKQHFDVVMLDLSIPQNSDNEQAQIDNGLKLIPHIPSFPDTSIIAYTDYPSITRIIKVLKNGGNDFLVKTKTPLNEEIFQRVYRVYQRLEQERKKYWTSAILLRNSVREKVKMRSLSDNYSLIVSDLMTNISSHEKNIERLLRIRFGIELTNINDDDLSIEMIGIKNVLHDASKSISVLRVHTNIEQKLSIINVKKTLNNVLNTYSILASLNHQVIKSDLEELNGKYKVFIDDFRAAFFDIYICALKNATAGSRIYIEGNVDKKANKLCISIKFNPIQHELVEYIDEKILESVKNCLNIVKVLAKSMGGDAKYRTIRKKTISIKFNIPVMK